jgi:2-dehydro-3-deoxyphosphogluconate aldolase/(4S)-4-hydroxy-2-oxoglutarate aldolase
MANNAHDRSKEPFRQRLARVRVLPVITVEDAEQGVALVRALAAGGLDVVEITLRTPAALEAIHAVGEAVPAVMVGAGTVLGPESLFAAEQAGAQFAVSPGLTPRLAGAAQAARIPLMPGVATATEAMVAADAGLTLLKLFPAAAIGGIALLRSLFAPLPELSFCPTGGVDAASYQDYLGLPNVLCVGGSWMIPKAALAAGDWADITRRGRELSAHRPSGARA